MDLSAAVRVHKARRATDKNAIMTMVRNPCVSSTSIAPACWGGLSPVCTAPSPCMREQPSHKWPLGACLTDELP